MKVLIATDNSSSSDHAALFLRELHFHEPLDVILLTVAGYPPATNTEYLEPWFPDWVETQRELATKNHAMLTEKLRNRCASIRRMYLPGHAANVILEQAAEEEVDLIVMGARGHSLLDRVLLGSISDYVATHAKTSVLVVRPNSGDFTDKELASQHKRANKISIAYDGSNQSRASVDEMLQLDWDRDSQAVVVSITPIYDYIMGDGMTAAAVTNEDEIFSTMNQAAQRMCKRVRGTLPNSAAVVTRNHHVGDAIVNIANENGSDLLVIGDAGHGRIHDLILGNTTKYVLRHANCSVWISRHAKVQSAADSAESSGMATT
ncbi:MAG: universal stress protein [Pirellulaceae bacterium]|nr:universal stress protein [Pirellulaceae bacterium]